MLSTVAIIFCFIRITSQETIYYGANVADNNNAKNINKRDVDPTFRGHPKTREEKWAMAFHGSMETFNQVPSLVNLLNMLAAKHLNDCATVILYDKVTENSDGFVIQQLMKSFPLAYVHGRITLNSTIAKSKILKTITDQCVNYILLMADVMASGDLLGLQATSKVIVVGKSSQWRVHEFLYSKASRNFVNLLVIAQSFRDDDTLETPYILYTHTLFIDGLGSSKPQVLTSWSKGKLARPHVNLFPPKITNGYAGHRFTVVAANQPPFVFKKVFRDYLGNPKVTWEGIEYRLINLLGHKNNFSVEIKEPEDLSVGSGDAVWTEVSSGHADIGMGGLYITPERIRTVDMSASHSHDCAVFISLTSTALPRYRAIMGPFHWTVWVTLTFTYLIGIFPLAFSDKHTLKHLVHNSGEVENMFWYVFGTFTNCFTFVGKNSWSKTTKVTTRLLIGWYWIFTIIITACYTGSIIAFVTLPVYPETVDTVKQLLDGHYRVGTLDRGGWEVWFTNSSDKQTNKLLKHLEFVPNVETGLANTTKAFFWPYVFLGSRYQLEYVVQSNFTMESSKRAVLHISDNCFAPFGVSLAFPKESVYTEKLNSGILTLMQTGIVSKLENDVKWKMQRSSTGKLLQASSGNSIRAATVDERGLSLGDTQGMFLLLAAGFVAAGAALLSEWLGGCGRMCRLRRKPPSARSNSSTATTINSSNYNLAPNPSPIDNDEELNTIYSASKRSVVSSDNKLPLINNGQSKDLFIVNVEESKDNMNVNDNVSIDSDKNVIATLEVAVDINQSIEMAKKTHSRRSSHIDWDGEISRVFQCVRDSNSDDEFVNKNNPIYIEEDDNHTHASSVEESLADLFGERINIM
ncbi:ionotropic receptor 21a [Arctopsyche grandis]|uniref:ionotropic receptor 21a n=1 Tax=Arctopsyche grandis TaxID=121162 RepID=UPI00406D7DB1